MDANTRKSLAFTNALSYFLFLSRNQPPDVGSMGPKDQKGNSKAKHSQRPGEEKNGKQGRNGKSAQGRQGGNLAHACSKKPAYYRKHAQWNRQRPEYAS